MRGSREKLMNRVSILGNDGDRRLRSWRWSALLYLLLDAYSFPQRSDAMAFTIQSSSVLPGTLHYC